MYTTSTGYSEQKPLLTTEKGWQYRGKAVVTKYGYFGGKLWGDGNFHVTYL